MRISERCIGCRQCWAVCPARAIGPTTDGRRSQIEESRCVECGACLRSRVCPVDAFERNELVWPRSLRSTFSDVTSPHKATGVLGRGTEEMKTNDVTGRLVLGRVNVSVELGRPGVTASFADVQIVTRRLAAFGVHWQDENPVTSLISDRATGELALEVLNERVLSALIEFDIEVERVPALYSELMLAALDIDTVFSLAMAAPVAADRSESELADVLRGNGIFYRPNGKTNVGLGRPFKAPVADTKEAA
ncbi:MAG: 4Fe-4S binding protein [Duodenibacillus sp.]